MDTCHLHVRKFQRRTQARPLPGVCGEQNVHSHQRFHSVTPRLVRTQVLLFPVLCLLSGTGESLVPLLGWSAPRPPGAQPQSELRRRPPHHSPDTRSQENGVGPAAGETSQRQWGQPFICGPHSVPFLFEAHTPGRLQSSADHPVFKHRRQGQERNAPAESRRRARGTDAPVIGVGGRG